MTSLGKMLQRIFFSKHSIYKLLRTGDRGFPIGWTNSKEILFCNNLVRRNIIESCIIKFNALNVLNISPGMYKLDNYLVEMIASRFK